jgi:hypothetical protein
MFIDQKTILFSTPRVFVLLVYKHLPANAVKKRGQLYNGINTGFTVASEAQRSNGNQKGEITCDSWLL